jgi:biopolymer transport protein ExbB
MTKLTIKLLFLAVLAAACIGGTVDAALAQATSDAPAATAVPTPPAGMDTSTSREIIENPYGLEALWRSGDYVARGTLFVLLVMSMGSWWIIVIKLVEQFRLARQAQEAAAKFWRAPTVQAGAAALAEGSAFRAMVESGLSAADRQDNLLTRQIAPQSRITLALQQSADEVAARLQAGLAFLATVGSTAPFVGLFGTVWGIYNSLTIGIAGQASIDKVAGPVGEALIMTAFGLVVAVPAVLGYNWLQRRNKALLERARNFTASLHVLLAEGDATPTMVSRSA